MATASGGGGGGGAAAAGGSGPGAYGLGLANERLRILEELEREIGTALQSAGTVILELSKEKPNERLLDRQASQFVASVQKVESELSAQIRYLTQVATGQPHEGSSYSARKDCQMALKRIDYAQVKLGELSRTCEQMLLEQ
ncbi:mediator of RNA polymerase II transcription subunit 11 [Anolis carolinensis]|uniref:mediator of RNA polymerase II transcription subunit 11 n=1 Tax=Anolis carolinensis TaxID=28377 RepID=UPI002F2B7903